MIYRLVTRATIEERMMQQSKKKMVLEHMVVHKMSKMKDGGDLKQTELSDIIRWAAGMAKGGASDGREGGGVGHKKGSHFGLAEGGVRGREDGRGSVEEATSGIWKRGEGGSVTQGSGPEGWGRMRRGKGFLVGR